MGKVAAQARLCELLDKDPTILDRFGLGSGKFGRRGYTLDEAVDEPGKFVMSVERHRAIGGACYQKGVPMPAYRTYSQQILFDPVALTLSEYREINLAIDIDFPALAAQHLRNADEEPEVWTHPDWGGKRRVVIPLDRGKPLIETDSIDAAREAVEAYFEVFDYSIPFGDFEESVAQGYGDKLLDAITRSAVATLEAGWRDPMEYED